jgi:hypothetical protein
MRGNGARTSRARIVLRGFTNEGEVVVFLIGERREDVLEEVVGRGETSVGCA